MISWPFYLYDGYPCVWKNSLNIEMVSRALVQYGVQGSGSIWIYNLTSKGNPDFMRVLSPQGDLLYWLDYIFMLKWVPGIGDKTYIWHSYHTRNISSFILPLAVLNQ